MSKSILLLGAGGHAFVITDILHTLQDITGEALYGKIDFLDDASELAVGSWQNWNKSDGIMRKYFAVSGIINSGRNFWKRPRGWR